MKKYLFLFIGLLASYLIVFFFYSHQLSTVPKATIILNKLDDHAIDFPAFFYSDINLTNTVSYSINGDTLVALPEEYMPYTEGFIPEPLYKKINNILSTYDSTLPSYFHDYYLNDSLAVVAFSGSLKEIYLLNLETSSAYPLLFDERENLGNMYVSHMEVVEDTLVILGGEAHSYSILIYTVDLKTGEVLSSKRLPTHPSTLYEEDFAILSSGECIFVAGNALMRYNPFLDTTTTMPLPFESTRVLAYENTGLVFGESKGRLEVLSLDGSIHTTLKMPVMDYRIVDLLAYDQFLYIALFDPAATRYPNYFCIYDLKTGEWLYALGIESLENQALLFIENE